VPLGLLDFCFFVCLFWFYLFLRKPRSIRSIWKKVEIQKFKINRSNKKYVAGIYDWKSWYSNKLCKQRDKVLVTCAV
jgi:hypothetical protein